MLHWLLYHQIYLAHAKQYPFLTPFRVFQYVTFRTAFASLTALFLCVVLGPWLIGKLREFQIGQHIREEGPRSHQSKAGTPTMGGVLVVIAVVLSTLLWADLRNPYVWVAMLGLVGFGAIGFYDDVTKVKKMRNLGLTARRKMLLQVLMTLLIGSVLLILHASGAYDTSMNVPFAKNFHPDLLISRYLASPWTYPLAFIFFFGFLFFVLVGSTNAVNLTDGLDGLAIGLMIIASGATTILAYVSGHAAFGQYLEIVRLRGSEELTIYCAAMTGASLGFLWYNAHPAQIFMGDVGSLALGGSLGVVMVLIKQEILLVFIGGVYVMEALSVILQVGSYKLRGKRIFKMAPLHHHFELSGVPESKLIVRFWIIAIILTLLTLSTLKLR